MRCVRSLRLGTKGSIQAFLFITMETVFLIGEQSSTWSLVQMSDFSRLSHIDCVAVFLEGKRAEGVWIQDAAAGRQRALWWKWCITWASHEFLSCTEPGALMCMRRILFPRFDWFACLYDADLALFRHNTSMPLTLPDQVLLNIWVTALSQSHLIYLFKKWPSYFPAVSLSTSFKRTPLKCCASTRERYGGGMSCLPDIVVLI